MTADEIAAALRIFPGRNAGASLKHATMVQAGIGFNIIFPGRNAGASLKL